MNKSDGYHHDRITITLSPFCGIGCDLVALYFGWGTWPVIISGLVGIVGCLFGLICNPDLDQPGLTSAETKWIKAGVFGTTFMGAWIMIWGLYTKLIPHHRHWSSHAPIIGTLGRVVYLAALPALIIVMSGNGPAAWSLFWAWPYAVMFVAALAVADIGHWARDYF